MSKENGQTLLQKARAARPSHRKPLPADYKQRLDLALAFCRCEVTAVQCAEAMGVRPNNAHTTLGIVLLQAIKREDLEIIDKRKSRRS